MFDQLSVGSSPLGHFTLTENDIMVTVLSPEKCLCTFFNRDEMAVYLLNTLTLFRGFLFNLENN